jgi:7-cyano-7-deazaguanine reductase
VSYESLLGRQVDSPDRYSPQLLHAIPREEGRKSLRLGDTLPFSGTDVLNAWELTWLDPLGVPRCAAAEIRIPAESPALIESKSLKLYLGSFAMTEYPDAELVADTIAGDLAGAAGDAVRVALRSYPGTGIPAVAEPPGETLDTLATRCDATQVDPALLSAQTGEIVTEALHSHALRSLCPITGQPDMGSVLIAYRGPRIDREGLLRYIVSFRRHGDFHEACVERMFVDVLQRCAPERLTVYARYLRRGGIDINPFRSNFETDAPNLRLARQ